MKFQHLGIGQQFWYQGELYVKDGPVMAQHLESGKKSLIPRSAELQAAAGESSQARNATPQRQIDSAVLLEALNAYEYEIKMGINTLVAGDPGPRLSEILQQARDRLLRGLEL